MLENTTAPFYTATATDPQNDPVVISLYGGPDADKFVLGSDGGLRFNSPPNFDLPNDANGDNVYELTLRATANGESVDLALRVKVTNDKEGVAVTRVATGLVNPVGMAFEADNSTFKIAERGGRVMTFNPATNTLVEDTFIRDHRQPGDLLSIVWGFSGNVYQEGIYVVSLDPASGLKLQAFNANRDAFNAESLGAALTAPVKASMLQSGSILIAIGDPGGTLAQDASSPYGKLIELGVIDPYAGASVPRKLEMRPQIIGDGIQKPGGFSSEFGRVYLADQASSAKNEITIFQTNWRPLDFGWPFWEGSMALRSNPPSQVNGPTIEYDFGTGKKQGTGVIAGIINDYRFFPPLGNVYVFGDANGSIWSIGYDKITSGFLQNSSAIEDRTLDFAPDQGQSDSPVAIVQGGGSDRFYILDSDGEIFRVQAAP